jgi:hypothetical protein
MSSHSFSSTHTDRSLGRAGGKNRSSDSVRHFARGLLWTLGIIAAVLVLVQLVASPVAKRVINGKLAAMPGFEGHVDRVNLALWRGGADLHEFVLHEKGHENDTPVVHVKRVSGKAAIPSLVRGKLMGELLVDGAEIVAVKDQIFGALKEAGGKAKEKTEQVKQEAGSWQEALGKAFPMEITKFEMKNSKVRFIDRSHEPAIDVGIENLHIVGSGLKNRNEGDPLPAKVTLEGETTGQGKLRIETQADPLARAPRFATKMELREQQLPPLNALLQAYMGVDLGSGVFELYTEIKAENGTYNGYSKPFLKDLDFKTPDDKNKRLGQKIKEGAADVVTTVLKNKNDQKVATEAPISGTLTNNNTVDVWTTVDNLLRNAFVEALRTGFGRETKVIRK